MNTITRKIQVLVNSKDKEHKNLSYEKLRNWNFVLQRCANLVATHQFVLENSKDLLYMEDEIKYKIADMSKDESGILSTSRMNATYRLLSKEHLEHVPSTFLTTLNSIICQSFNKEKKDYWSGKRSLRNYKSTLPMPFQKTSLRNFVYDKNIKNYTFDLCGIPFRTYLGKDRSWNVVIIDRVINGEYSLSDPALQHKNNKWFLLLTVKFETQPKNLDIERKCYANLDIETPIIVKTGKQEAFEIGSKEEFLHRRLQIQLALRRLQIALRYNESGNRKRKLQAIERFHEKEKNYIKSKLHIYSRMLVNYAIKNLCGKIVLENYDESKETAKKDKFLLRNWNYYGLKQMIEYKARMAGIDVL